MSTAGLALAFVFAALGVVSLLFLVSAIVYDLYRVLTGQKSLSWHIKQWGLANPGLAALASLGAGLLAGMILGGLVGHFWLPERGN